MKHRKSVTALVIFISLLSAASSSVGILSKEGPGQYEFKSIHGENVKIFGKGIYQHMSSDVAIQGIAQDYVTLFIAIPVLLISLFKAWKGSLRGLFLLAGTCGYFYVTYLFYLAMAYFNPLFLAYSFLMGASIFALFLTVRSINVNDLPSTFSPKTPAKPAGIFLIFIAFTIGLLWLGTVVPPLIDGTIYPETLQHYTTLIVQGMDLGFGLPLAAVSGYLLLKKNSTGLLIGPVYLIFLSLLMTALVSKIIVMGISGYNIFPVIFIIPSFAILSILFSFLLLKNIFPEQV